MLKISFINATVSDTGFGISVNGKSLEDIISTALGTKVGNIKGYNSGLPNFDSNSCDVTVIIDPHPTEEHIEVNGDTFDSVEDMEEVREHEYTEKFEKTDPEE